MAPLSPSVVIRDFDNPDCFPRRFASKFDNQPPLFVQPYRVLALAISRQLLEVQGAQRIERSFIAGRSDLLHPPPISFHYRTAEPGAESRVGLKPIQGCIFELNIHGRLLYMPWRSFVNAIFTHSVKSMLTVSVVSSTTERRAQILGMMVEGNSIRAIVRMTGVSKNTIVKLLEDAGAAFSAYQDKEFRDLPCKRIQLDEIWAFSYCKQRNIPFAKNAPEIAGDLWTWVALCADTKLVPSWRVGDRSGDTAIEFVCDLSKRLTHRVQVTSDGHRAYLEAVEAGFGADVDYAQLVKLYGEVPHPAGRYGPAQIQGTKTFCCAGDPDPRHISTSYVERQNLTMRVSMRRFTRLSNGFSKKAENHTHAVAVHFMHYNFVRIHQSLRISPAMAAGVSTKLWSLADMVRVIENWEMTRAATPGDRLVG
jgi:IS1 family transposase